MIRKAEGASNTRKGEGREDGKNYLLLRQVEEMALQVAAPALRAYSDPSIFRNDRVSNATT